MSDQEFSVEKLSVEKLRASMAVGRPLSLEDCCLAWLVSDLEHYPPELLALLPLRLRHRLLANVPVLDLCQLEHTSVAEGVDVESIWEVKCSPWGEEGAAELTNFRYLRFIDLNSLSWRDRYLHTVAFIVLNNSIMFRNQAMSYLSQSDSLQYFRHFFYYAIAANQLISLRGYQFLNEGGDLQSSYDWQNLASSFFFFEAEGGNRYDRLTPPRYVHYKSGCSTRPSDEELITLLLRNCHFKPKCLLVSLEFSSQIKAHGILKEFLNEVEEVYMYLSAFDLLPKPAVLFHSMFSGISPCKLRTLQLRFQHNSKHRRLNEHEKGLFQKSMIEIIVDVIKQQYFLEAICLIFMSRFKYAILASDEIITLAASLTSFIARPQFRTLDIHEFRAPVDVVTDILSAFLVSPCSHKQTLRLPRRMTMRTLSRRLHRAATPCPAEAMPVPDSGVEYKELYLHQDHLVDESYVQICKTVFAFPKIRLRFLEVGCLQTIGNHYINTIHMAAQHPDIRVKTLSIRLPYNGIREDVVLPTLRDDMRALFQIPTLANFSLPPMPSYTASNPGNSFLPILAEELPMRHHLAAIEELDLGRSNFLELPAEEVEHLFQSIFSLPHLSQLTLKLTYCVVSFHHYKLIHRLWTEYSSGERLQELVIGSAVFITEKEYTDEFSITGIMPLLDSMAQSTNVVRFYGKSNSGTSNLIEAEIPTSD